MRGFLTRAALAACVAALACAIASRPALADKIKHPIAVFSGLDKITGRIIVFEVSTDETVQFGDLQITERACYTRPSTEAPQTTTFIEVDEVNADKEYKKIFSGWMFASSPGLHGIEHPIYDIWLTGCKGGGEVVPSPDAASEAAAPPPPPPETPKSAAQKQPPRQRRARPAEDAAGAAPPPDAGSPPPQGRGPIEVGPPPGLIPPAPVGGRYP